MKNVTQSIRNEQKSLNENKHQLKKGANSTQKIILKMNGLSKLHKSLAGFDVMHYITKIDE